MESELGRSRRQFLLDSTHQATALVVASGLTAQAGETDPRSESPTDHRFRPVTEFRVPGRRATALAVSPEDQVFVAADRHVHVFDRRGTELRTIDFDRTPRSIAVDRDGTLYVAFARGIEAVRGKDQSRVRWNLPTPTADVWFSGIALNGDEVCVADSAGGVVRRFNRDGVLLGTLAPASGKFSAPPEFFALGARDGRLQIADPRRHRVVAFAADGDRERTWGGASRDLVGFAGCCNPVALAVRSDGCIVTAERGLPRIKLYSPAGEFLALIAGPEDFSADHQNSASDNGFGCSTGGFALAVDSTDRLLVLDRLTREIRIIV